MIFEDPRFDEFTRRVEQVLYALRGHTALDIACGYGRFAHCFVPQDYTGVDFSENMVELSKQFPGYKFICEDVKKWNGGNRKWDVVFEVNSLKSLDMTPTEFFDKYSKYASKFIACLEADEFIIKQLYT